MNVPPPNYNAPQVPQDPSQNPPLNQTGEQSQQILYPQMYPTQEPGQTQIPVQQQPMHQPITQPTHPQVVQQPMHPQVVPQPMHQPVVQQPIQQPAFVQQHDVQQVQQPTYQPVIQQTTHQQFVQQPMQQQVVPQPMQQQVVQPIHPQLGQKWYNYIFVALNGYVLAFDVNAHQMVWKTSLPGVGWNQTSIACENLMDGNGRLFVAVGKRLHCLDPKTGNIVWKTSVKGTWCYLKIEPEALFVATNGFLHSVDKITGNINYTTSITGFSYDITSMVVTPNIIYVGNNGQVRAISRQDGTLLNDWKNDLPGKGYIELTLALHDNVVTAGISGSVVAINLSNAVTARDTKFKMLSGSTVSLMWRSPGILIVGSDMCVRAIDSLTHNKIWKNPLTGCGPDGTVSLVQTDKRIYAGANGYVVCIDPETGSTLWKTSLSGTGVFGYFVSMHIRGNVLYAGCNGVLLALDLLSGNILWTDKLKGCSHGNVQICDFQNNMDLNAQPQLQALRAEMRTQEQAAATSATRNIPQ